MKTYATDKFRGGKETLLNMACQRWQLTRPNKVGPVMELIRQCCPSTFAEWESWYFAHAETTGKEPVRITRGVLSELGERLYAKLTEVLMPQLREAMRDITKDDCVDYIYNLTVNRTYDGYLREKSVVNDGLAKRFPNVRFEESDTELDHAGDVDYVAHVGSRQFGIQVKPVTAHSNYAGYSLTERMKASFASFEETYGGKVFVVFSIDGEIANQKVVDDIEAEISRLSRLTSSESND